jgi:hypothetical protein
MNKVRKSSMILYHGVSILSVLCWVIVATFSSPMTLHAAEISRQIMLSQPEKIPDWIAANSIGFEDIPNPHWNSKDCTTCHRNTPKGKSLFLRGKSIDALCEYCHSGKYDHSYIHPSGIPLGNTMRKQSAKGFTNKLDARGRLTCVTCHEIKAQCLSTRRSEQRINPLFLRDGPYRVRSEICYKCHDIRGYQRRNAHDQIDDKGQIKEYTCRICHNKTKGLENAKSITEVGFNVKNNLVRICGSCHDLKPHPSGNFTFTSKGVPNHLVVPPEAIKEKMQQSERKNHILLPLDPVTGKVFCGTCHNPHEKGVIKNEAAAKGADEKNRLRMQNICTSCHDK